MYRPKQRSCLLKDKVPLNVSYKHITLAVLTPLTVYCVILVAELKAEAAKIELDQELESQEQVVFLVQC